MCGLISSKCKVAYSKQVRINEYVSQRTLDKLPTQCCVCANVSSLKRDLVAEAVERSAIVLICMTEQYKDSANCRLEGEYCNQQKKPFIPLLMQDKYRPNGW